MAFYRNSYVPAFTSNDTYGNFYDASKVSLITVPERLKNYDLDVRKAGTPTTAAEYGDFLRRDGQFYRAPPGFSRLQEQRAELQQARFGQQDSQPEGSYGYDTNGGYYQQPQPLPPHHLPPLQPASRHLEPESPPVSPSPEQRQDAAELSDRQRPDSIRGPPPPASLERYRGIGKSLLTSTEPATMQRQVLQQQLPPPSTSTMQEPYQYRISRSRSPPPPPDLDAYRSNPEAYTGRARADVPPTPPAPQSQSQQLRQQQLSSMPPPPPQQQPLEPQLPPVRLGQREVYLPSIEAVEVRMRDNSKVMLDVRDFYRRYLRD